MSGHSKWANIRVKKTAQDAKRGKVFTRHAKLIEIAARAGGADPAENSQLRTAIENAKLDNVPGVNIDRAVAKGTGTVKGEAMQEVTYEAYLPLRSSGLPAEASVKAGGAEGGGPGGIAFIIECLSDNRNRTIANIKMIFTKFGGRLADANAVAWMFDRKGLVVASRRDAPPTSHSSHAPTSVAPGTATTRRLTNTQNVIEQLELELIDFGAEDIVIDGDVIRVVTDVTNWPKMRDFLKGKEWTIETAGLSYIPKQKIPVTDEATAKKIMDFIAALEEDDDVSEVHTNVELLQLS